MTPTPGTVIFGGPEAKLVRVRGDITYSIEHVNGQESVVLWRSQRAPGNGAGVVGITVLGAYFNGKTGMPTAAGMTRCRDMLKVMGFSALDSFALRRLLDTLYEAVDEVIKLAPMKPRGIDLSGVEGVVLRANGDVVMRH